MGAEEGGGGRQLQTEVIHAGEEGERVEGAVVLPIFQSATFASGDAGTYDEIRYLRLNNTPNHRVLHRKLAAVAGGEDALVTSSGMAAITTTLLSLLKSGDHLLAQDCLYGGTYTFLTEDAPGWGIGCTFVPGDRPEAWEAALRPTTRVLYLESMSNPLLEVPDLEGAVAFARRHDLVTVVDNTFATLAEVAPSLGGVETLVSVPAATSHAGLPAAERSRIGIGDGLVRVAVGIEAAGDLCADFAAALEGV